MKNLMKPQIKRQRGQALIIIVFAMIGLIGMTGLAVDGGLAFSDRRHAQNAADTAAMAYAMKIINKGEHDTPSMLKLAAMDIAGQNGYNSDLVSNTVEVYTCDEVDSSCGNYAGKPEYVQVIITSHINTYFAGVIGIPQMHNRVQAIALAEKKVTGPLYNGANIVSLAKECENPDNFIIEGNPIVNLVDLEDASHIGGMFINTDDEACGFTCSSNSSSITGSITTAGGDINFGGLCSATGEKDEDGEQWDFPVTLDDMDIDVPTECYTPVGTYTNYTNGNYPGYPGVALTVLTPGTYSDFPPQKEQPLGALNDTILMLPGVYCVNHVIKLSTQQLTLIGKDVTFFLREGYEFDLNGGKITLDAPDSGPYAGYLMILEPDYDSAPLNCSINGSTYNTFTGAIFAPYCNITLNGGSEPTGFESQIIGYTIKITGTSTINFTFNADENPENTMPPEIGLMK